MRFAAFERLFFDKRKSKVLTGDLSAPSLKSDQIRFAKLLPAFRGKELNEVSSYQIETFLDSLILNGRSPATRNRYRALLHSYFKHAIRAGYCERNPVTEVPISSERLKTRPLDFWSTKEECEAYLRGAFNYSAVFGVGATILCFGGCRISEALALKWEDFEWDRDYVRIRRIIERHTGLACNRTKGQRAGGEYQMLLVPRLRTTLLNWRQRSFHNEGGDFVLTQPLSGSHFKYDMWQGIHHKVISLAGVKRITLHDLRRTFASHAERLGFHRAEIGKLLGHETLEATKTYTRADLSNLAEKAKRVGFGVEQISCPPS